ncbi:hypothetical protein Ancab_014004 [Ancistrocladus abbreviatus]
MPFFSASFLGVSNPCIHSRILSNDSSAHSSSSFTALFNSCNLGNFSRKPNIRRYQLYASEINASTGAKADEIVEDSSISSASPEATRPSRGPIDWEAARTYKDAGFIYEGRVEGFNGGGLLVSFYSLVGFLPFPQLSPSHSCKDPLKNIQEIARGLVGSVIPMKLRCGCSVDSIAAITRRNEGVVTTPLYDFVWLVMGFDDDDACIRSKELSMGPFFLRWAFLVPCDKACASCRSPCLGCEEVLILRLVPQIIDADEDNRKLIFSEKEAIWLKYSEKINVGDVFEARVGTVEDYGAFVHLRFPDGYYHLTGLVHVSEVSWDLVQDVRDILNEGDDVRVKVINIDREKSRITLSIKQLEEDPLLETLDKVIPQDGSVGTGFSSASGSYNIEPLPGLKEILKELLLEDGITDVKIRRQGFERRVVSQDLQLWLSNAPAIDNQFTILARAGRQVQEIQMTTSLDQEGIKKALQRVLERVP